MVIFFHRAFVLGYSQGAFKNHLMDSFWVVCCSRTSCFFPSNFCCCYFAFGCRSFYLTTSVSTAPCYCLCFYGRDQTEQHFVNVSWFCICRPYAPHFPHYLDQRRWGGGADCWACSHAFFFFFGVFFFIWRPGCVLCIFFTRVNRVDFSFFGSWGGGS